jgi:hypothetical protein
MIFAEQTIGHMVWSAGATDAHGNPVDEWAAPVNVAVYGYGPPAVRAETEPGGTQVVSHLEVYAPPFIVDPRDRMVVDGVTYGVSGEVGDWDNGPFRYTPGVVIRLKRVEGGR